MKQAVLYDFHGTLVDVTGVRHFLGAGDYDGFYLASLSCPPIDSTVMAARQSYEAGYSNLLFTGMPGDYAAGLSDWLDHHHVPVSLISMRTPGDYRKDFIVKQEMYLRALGRGYEILRAWDDSPACLDLWTRQGIPVVPVPGWDSALKIGRVDKPPMTS